ncbi:MAG TPA: hypothetical protein VIJ02_14975 [Thermoanaerobaculia bacterium]|jgi:hypothetical protein
MSVITFSRGPKPPPAAPLTVVDAAQIRGTAANGWSISITVDERDDASLADARKRWKELVRDGAKLEYWRRRSGRWERVA